MLNFCNDKYMLRTLILNKYKTIKKHFKHSFFSWYCFSEIDYTDFDELNLLSINTLHVIKKKKNIAFYVGSETVIWERKSSSKLFDKSSIKI